ncbi:MAG TPA: glycosyl transferase family protein [Bryobacteraceae bacterium]|nr:glycosyl transferase family protein [Bryobacteraceae bacterium]
MLWCLIPLALWILVSGIDDLFIALVFLLPRRRFRWPTDAQLERAPERRIAILVPLWKEHRVIGQMLEHNLAAIRYTNYEIFVGVYPNDPLTAHVVSDVARRFPRVRLATCPHDGPTSKGDCLNSLYRAMASHEARGGAGFEIVVTHDAEDLIHPDALRLINWFSRFYEMVQIPVLALPTPLRELTHGLYCDEFAEFQQKDIPVRQRLGGFIPSNGVGTGFDRASLDRLAAAHGGRVFDPECLTEDYETGLRLYRMGCRQIFVPLRFRNSGPVATREYFPRNLRGCVRQRSRWVAGIALQGWQRQGWRGPRRQIYWFWRDRKGLVGNLLAPAANLMVFGAASGVVRGGMPAWAAPLCVVTLAFSLLQAILRGYCSSKVYGRRFLIAMPARMLWGNIVNCLATLSAFRQFFAARIYGRSLAWRKTDHAYPAQAVIPLWARSGEAVDPPATRALPARTIRRWKVMPYRLTAGQLHVATSDLPSPAMIRELSGLCALQIRYRLAPPQQVQALTNRYLPEVKESTPTDAGQR